MESLFSLQNPLRLIRTSQITVRLVMVCSPSSKNGIFFFFLRHLVMLQNVGPSTHSRHFFLLYHIFFLCSFVTCFPTTCSSHINRPKSNTQAGLSCIWFAVIISPVRTMKMHQKDAPIMAHGACAAQFVWAGTLKLTAVITAGVTETKWPLL